LNSQCRFFTDTGTLAIFDPARLDDRVSANSDWWCSDLLELEEIQTGSVALVSLSGDGVYRLRITNGDLTVDERDYATCLVSGLGVEVSSGELFVGPAECVPSGGSGFTATEVSRGLLLKTENGQYDIKMFAIDWLNSPRWWRDDHSISDDALVDLVAVLRPRSTPFTGVDSQPRLNFSSDTYIFESTTRRVGPEPGMILTTKVRKNLSSELCLKDCGPRGYQASLVDNAGIAWKDTIRLKVLSVDHTSKTLIGEFVDKV
jgi:hypothetical protein